MTHKTISIAIGLAFIVFIALFVGYKFGADRAETHNRVDAATVIQTQ